MAIWYKLHADLHTLVNARHGRSQCPRVLRRGSASICLPGLRVRIPPGTWVSVTWQRCVLSGRGLINRPEKFYRVWCVLSVIVKPLQ